MHPFILIIFFIFNNVACTNLTKNKQIQASEKKTEKAKPEVQTKNEPEPTTTSMDLAWSQHNLDILGYEPGNFDGKLTAKTKAALKSFQKKFKLPITGKLNKSTYRALEREVERKKREYQKSSENVTPPPPMQSVKPKPTPAMNPQNKQKYTQKTTEKVRSPARAFTDIQTVGVYLVAALLAEKGYFKFPLKQAKLETVEAALKSFQKDIGLTQTGILDEVTLKKLQSIKLSSARQAELDAVSSLPAKKKTVDSALPDLTLKTGESVFAIEKIECKSDNEALVLFYEGQLQELQKTQVRVNVNKRYAMWYDLRHYGVSKTDWWCIPKKRFCYSSIDFTDWGGKLKSGDVGSFEKKLTIPGSFDITALVAHASKRKCSF